MLRDICDIIGWSSVRVFKKHYLKAILLLLWVYDVILLINFCYVYICFVFFGFSVYFCFLSIKLYFYMYSVKSIMTVKVFLFLIFIPLFYVLLSLSIPLFCGGGFMSLVLHPEWSKHVQLPKRGI